MKNSRNLIIFFAVFIALKINAQAPVNFTINPIFCEGTATTVTSSMNSAMAYSWAALPSGPVFSAPSSSVTNISFPTAGTYTIGHGVLTGAGFGYTTHIVVVNPSPSLSVTGSSVICSGGSATLTASGASGYTWSPAGSLNVSTGSSVIASPSGSGNYVVIGSIGSCTASISHSLSVVITPTVAIVPGQFSVCSGYSSTLTGFGAASYTWTGTGITAVVSQSILAGAGTYTLAGSNGGSCTSQTAITIGSLSDLTITVTQSSPTTCITKNFPAKISKPVHLTASGAGTYTWYPFNALLMTYSLGPSTDVRPAATTCYTVVGSTAVCTGSAVICVTVIPQFSAGISPAAPPVICEGDVISLNVVNIGSSAQGPPSAYTYIWSEPVSAPPISISSYFSPVVSVFPQNSCTYTVEVKDMSDCISLPAMVSVSVTLCNNLHEAAAEDQFVQLYPNPANDLLYISSKKTGQLNVEILDALGKSLLKQSVDGNSSQGLKLNMPSGIYFVKISSVTGYSEVKRLVKE